MFKTQVVHDDTGPSKFTTKPRLREIVPTSHTCTQFSHGYSFYLCCFGNSFILKFASLHLESEAWW